MSNDQEPPVELSIAKMLQQGVAAHKDGKPQDAERFYRAILKIQPEHPDANHNLGVLAVSFNQTYKALPLFKTALKANPKMLQYWISYVDALIKEQDLESAKRVIQLAKERGMDTDSLDSLEAEIEVHTLTTNAGEVNPPQEMLKDLLAQYENGQYKYAEELASSLCKKFPSHPLSWSVLGAVLRKTGRVELALSPCRKSALLSPDDAAVHYNLGITLKELGRLEEAENSYRKAIALNPDFAEAHNNLGITLQELGRIDASDASFKKAITLKPDNADAYNNRSVTLRELGKLEEAGAASKRAIALQPNYAEAHNNLANSLKEQGRLVEAEQSYDQAIALKPDFVDALMNRWQLLYDKKDYDAALKDIETCNTDEARAGRLETLYALGRIDEVYTRLEELAESDDCNLRISAFASFISTREKRAFVHKFCPDPLKFLHISNISNHLEGANNFIMDLIEELQELEVIWEPYGKATVGGFQTLKQTNLFERPHGKLKLLKSIILDEINAYYLKYESQPCAFIQRWPSEKHLRAWYVSLQKQGFQKPHIHPDGWLSGVIYLKVVDPLEKDEGAIEFSLNGQNYSDKNTPSLLHQPNAGDIILFPSSLHHRTLPFTSDTDRMIVSFDLKPGSFGRP